MLTAFLLSLLLVGQIDKASHPAPDYESKAKAGDVAVLWSPVSGERLHAAGTYPKYKEFLRLVAVGDLAARRRYEAARNTILVPNGLTVRITAVHPAAEEIAAIAECEAIAPAAFKGSVFSTSLVYMVPPPAVPRGFNVLKDPDPRAEAAAAAKLAKEADALLAEAKKLDQANRRIEAVEAYRNIVRDYPGTRAAGLAEARLKAMARAKR